jgi:uncharacterized protein
VSHVRQASGPFTIALATLVEGVNHLRLEGSPEEAGIESKDADLSRPIVLEGDFVRTDNRVEVQARIATAVHLVCDRCLADLEQVLEASVRLFCEKQGRREQRGKTTTGRDDEGLMVYDGHTLDLRDEIRQVVLLEVPWHPLCKTDCKGLCPTCGKNRNLGDCGCKSRDGAGPWNVLRKALEEEGRPSDASREKE